MTLAIPPGCRVFTPPDLAEAMVAALGDVEGALWLEPSVGDGVFVQTLAARGVGATCITAVDLREAEGPCDHLARTIRGVDFIVWAGQASERYDRIVGNPPYSSLERVDKVLLSAALGAGDHLSLRVSKGANYWLPFVLASVRMLRERADMAFVLPAAWDYADYAEGIRLALPQEFETFEVHRSQQPLFEGIREGAVVVIGRRYGCLHKSLERYTYANRAELVSGLTIGKRARSSTGSTATVSLRRPDKAVPLGDVLRVHIGAVTGDARFFLLSETQRAERDLPEEACVPVITRARDLAWPVIGREEWSGLRERGARVWLFCPAPELLQAQAVRAYISYGEGGGCRLGATKIRERSPWYVTPLPQQIDGFLSGMAHDGPWIAFREYADLSASNTLYTVRFQPDVSHEEQYAWALAMLSSEGRASCRRQARLYPDGLRKLEPRDLEGAYVPCPVRVTGARAAYQECVKLLLSGLETRASELADAWVGR